MQRITCDPVVQDCPLDQKCTPYGSSPEQSWNTSVCVLRSSDPKEVSEVCRVDGRPVGGCDNCVLGAMCLFVFEYDGEGMCVAFCEVPLSDRVCAEEGKVCVVANDGVLPLCLDPCNPLAPACVHGECLHIDHSHDFACGPPWTSLGYGEPCTTELGSCAEGLACVSSDAFPEGLCENRCCTQVCDLSAPNECPHAADVQLCRSPYPPGQIPPGYENVGLCRIL
jgi:hypothetical protein